MLSAKKKHLGAFAVYSTRAPKFKLRRYQIALGLAFSSRRLNVAEVP